MSQANWPQVEIWKASLVRVQDPVLGPMPADYGPLVDVTRHIEPLRLIRRILSHDGPRLDLLELAGRPHAPDGAVDAAPGSAECPVLQMDDIVQLRTRTGADPSSGSAGASGVAAEDRSRVLFEGIVRSHGIEVGALGGGRLVDREVATCEESAVRLFRDRSAMLCGQWRAGRSTAAPWRHITGGPAEDPGLTIFNPGGRPNCQVASQRPTAWGSHATFSAPDADGSERWTIAEALRYVLAVGNGDERWVCNPDHAVFDVDGPLAEIALRLQETAPDSFVVQGLSVIEAAIELARCVRLRVDITLECADEAPNEVGQVRHRIVLWPAEAGRRRRPLYLQSPRERLQPAAAGEQSELASVTSVQMARYQRDAATIENAPLMLGDVERAVLMLPLIGAWPAAVNPPADIDDETYVASYVTNGRFFNEGDSLRLVFRNWTANLDGTVLQDGFGAESPPGTPLDALMSSLPVRRPRPFGRLPHTRRGLADPARLRPLIEWRHTDEPDDFRPLQPANVNLHPLADRLWIAAVDLRSIVHPRTGCNFWQACMDRLYAGGRLDLRLVCEVALDDRMQAAPARSEASGTQFVVGAVHDAVAGYRKRIVAPDLPVGLAAVPAFDESAEIETRALLVQRQGRSGGGFGSAALLGWDDTFEPGDRVPGIIGGRNIPFVNPNDPDDLGPEIVQVMCNFRTFQVELALGDLRQARVR